MKKKIICLMLLLIFSLASAQVKIPEPHGYVNDFANIIPDDIEQQLEAKLRAYEQQTSIEFAVVTTQSLEGLVIEDYSMQLVEKWKVGKKGKDNGVILLIAVDDRKLRLEVGYSLEGDLPDITCQRILDYKIVPCFKNKDYSGGILAGVDAVIEKLGTPSWEERLEQRKEKERKQKEAAEKIGIILLVIFVATAIIVVLVILMKKLIKIAEEAHKRRKRRKKAKQEAPGLIKKAKEALDKLKRKLEELEKQGYKLNKFTLTGLNNAQSVFDKAIKNLNAPPKLRDYEFICLETERAMEYVSDCFEDIKHHLDLKTEVEGALKKIPKSIDMLKTEIPKAKESLLKLKENNPKEVWVPIENGLAQVEDWFEKISSKLSSAEQLNSMEKQDFEAASSKIDECNKIIAQAEESINAPAKILEEIAEAKSSVGRFQSKLNNKIATAEKLIQDSDVDQRAKTLLKEAKDKLDEANRSLAARLINWLLVLLLLNKASELAEQSIDGAHKDIANAKYERRRAREEESSRSSWSSDSSRSSDSDFGGFGGGSFGGGGASSSW